jgi:hypothetical protein
VRVDNVAEGSGFLIGPNVVLTAWHVVRKLVNNGLPLAHSGRRLSVEFEGLALTDGASVPALNCDATEDWLVVSSPCHPKEIAGELPVAADLAGQDDFAVIELRELVGADRGFWRLADHGVAATNTKIWVFQHPRGLGLAYDSCRVVELYAPNRFLHSVNTDFGSSGGPCVDGRFELVGVHHAGGPVGKSNRGVPVAAFAARVLPRLVPRPAQFVWRLADGSPIVGRDDLQTVLWQVSIAPGFGGPQTRIISIFGGTVRARALATELVQEVLPAPSELIIGLDTGRFSSTAEELVRGILSAAGHSDPRGIELPRLANAGTTEAAWLRNQLVPAFVAELEKASNLRRTWLVVGDFAVQSIPPGQAEQFWLAFLEEIWSYSHFRVVLVGFQGVLPFKSMPHHRPVRLLDPTESDLVAFLERALPELSPKSCSETARQLWPTVLTEEAVGTDRADAIVSVLKQFVLAPTDGGAP